MDRHYFDPTQPTGTMSLDNLRNNFKALFQLDMIPLRVRAQGTPDMTVAVESSEAGDFYKQVYVGNTPLSFAGGNSSSITAPASNQRIDILTVNGSGTLAWITGTEAASPTPDWASLSPDVLPLALVYCKTTMTSIVNYEDKDTNSNEGYVYADVRPFVRLGSTTFLLLNDTPGSFSGQGGKVVKVNAGETALEFGDLSSAFADLTDTDISSPAQGDILFYNGSAWTNLSAGTAGYFLKTMGAGANPVWDQINVSSLANGLDVSGNNIRLKNDSTVLATITAPYATTAGTASSATTATNSTKLNNQSASYYRCSGCSWTCSGTCTGSCGVNCTGSCVYGCNGGCTYA